MKTEDLFRYENEAKAMRRLLGAIFLIAAAPPRKEPAGAATSPPPETCTPSQPIHPQPKSAADHRSVSAQAG
jgi:hypothetical protein